MARKTEDRRAILIRRINHLTERLAHWEGRDPNRARAELSSLKWVLRRDERLTALEELIEDHQLEWLYDRLPAQEKEDIANGIR